MEPHERIQEARERLGLSLEQAASAVGIPMTHLRDLEECAGDLTMTLSLADFGRLCRLLNLAPHVLLEQSPPRRLFSPTELRGLVMEHCREKGWSIEQFGDHVGWELQPLIDDPDLAVAGWNLDCLKDVCAQLGIAFAEAIPPPSFD